MEVMLDARERAPLAAHRDLYLDADGQVQDQASVDGPLAAGIPGIPAALVALARDYGALSLADNLAAAIRHAEEGFAIDEIYRRLATFRLAALRASPAASTTFLVAGQVPDAGYLLRQAELAKTLQTLATEGAEGFYGGEIAEQLVAGARAAGGIWQRQDLAQYRVVERPAIAGNYRGMRVLSAAPPSSGGIAIAQMLEILSAYGDLQTLPEAQRYHLIVEAMRRAYRDRALYLGDSDFVTIPTARLTSADYAAGLRAGIHPAARDTQRQPTGG